MSNLGELHKELIHAMRCAYDFKYENIRLSPTHDDILVAKRGDAKKHLAKMLRENGFNVLKAATNQGIEWAQLGVPKPGQQAQKPRASQTSKETPKSSQALLPMQTTVYNGNEVSEDSSLEAFMRVWFHGRKQKKTSKPMEIVT